ncbi:hypothetical protein EGW08_015599 [Elysia chlorotica]|uniref:Legumain n=1 Tax=Elysia chlorotica TaxID=188477 RepID=A0A3S1BBD1_ELYCH|nr:hypothetical protein EGW08_015599 [Elysia chlorotica]
MMNAISFTGTLAFLALASLTYGAERKKWALLIAGSAGYGNYKHQADVCHAYQITHKNGIHDEQIVVMMYDDITNNDYNPVQVEQFLANGTTVYNNKKQDRRTYPGNGVPTDMAGLLSLKRLAASSHPRHVTKRTEIKTDFQAQMRLKDHTNQVMTDIAQRVYTSMDISWTLNSRSETGTATNAQWTDCLSFAPALLQTPTITS